MHSAVHIIGLSDELLSELKAWRLHCPKGEDDLVFLHDNGRPLNHGILLRPGSNPALRWAKLRRIRVHDLRHTFASLLIAQNVHPNRIQFLMGCSTTRVTMDVYGHLMHDAEKAATEKLAALVLGGSKTAATQDAVSQKSAAST
ncbi:MAG: tyrosine-type recombinase/integrase [Proteobacteria bacterium]|nr:tyrosine-type recombinase/integrase [Pseudomonadota bacterium]